MVKTKFTATEVDPLSNPFLFHPRTCNEMVENCGTCKMFREHVYNDHGQRIRFLTPMLGDFSTRLIIPEKVVNLFRNDLHENIRFKGPSGKLWRLGLERVEGALCFESGWKDFLEDHNVEEGDVLVFMYDGFSCFDVFIFDPNGCEKMSCYLGKSKSGKKCRERESSVEILDEPRRRHKVIVCDSLSGSNDRNERHEALRLAQGDDEVHEAQRLVPNNVNGHDKSIDIHGALRLASDNTNVYHRSDDVKGALRLAPDGMNEMDEDYKELLNLKRGCISPRIVEANQVLENEKRGRGRPRIGEVMKVLVNEKRGPGRTGIDEGSIVLVNQKRGPGRPRKNSLSSNCEHSSVKREHEINTSSKFYMARKKKLTAEEEKRMFQLVASVQPRNPFFVSIMQPTHVKASFLAIPRAFAEDHLPKTTQTIFLQTPGCKRRWPVTFMVQTVASGFSKQWKRFARDNELEEGDIGLFELVDNQKHIMITVHFWRVTKMEYMKTSCARVDPDA